MSHLYQSSNIRFIFVAFSLTSAAYANLLLLWCGLISLILVGKLVHHSNDFTDALYGYHSYMAHGPPGTGNCTQPFEGKLEHDNWARLLYLLPRWLLVKPRGKRQLHAREIRGRVDSFMANEWRSLDKTVRLAGTTPAKRKNPPPAAATKGMTQRAIEKSKRELRAKVIKRAVKMIDVGDLGRGARMLGNPQYIITQMNGDEADPTGMLWNTVIDKARALHPDDDSPFDEYTECERRTERIKTLGVRRHLGRNSRHTLRSSHDILPETGGRPR
jgi:hypothetical protein